MNQVDNYIIFKNNLKDETIDDLLEDRKLYLLKKEKDFNNEYDDYIDLIEKEIEKRLNRYDLSYFKNEN